MDTQEWKILNRIEKLAERLPYNHLRIEISLKDGTDLIYEKDKQNPIGFRKDLTESHRIRQNHTD